MQKGFSNIFVILGVIIVAGIVGFFVFVNKPNPTIQPTPTTTPTQTTKQIPVNQQVPTTPTSGSETTNWKIYRSDKYGIEFKYPSEYKNIALKGGTRQGQIEAWTVKDEYKNDKFFIIFLAHNLNSFEYNDYTSSGKYTFDSKKKAWTLSSDTASFDEKYIQTLRSLTPAPIDLSFEAYKYSGGSGYCTWDSYLIPIRSQNLMIELQHNVCGNPPADEEVKRHDIISPLMISTLKFLNWKVYRNEKYGFEVGYPPDWVLEAMGDDDVTLEKKSVTKKSRDALIRIDIINNPKHLTLQGLFNEWNEGCEKDAVAGCPGSRNTTGWQQIKIGGVSALRSGKRSLPEGPKADSIYINKIDYYILVEGWYENPNYDSDFTSVFNQVISTFEFTAQ